VFTRSREFVENRYSSLVVQETSSCSKLVDILKVHDFNYIQKVIAHAQRLQGTNNKKIDHFDQSDTAISEMTWQAALLSAGAAVQAVDAVMSGEYRNAFCATRPPGHHAGIFGRTFHDDDSHKACSNGFCFINNVAVAASYAMSQYRNQIQKIAIVDFDVHHGNGTQEIVEALIGEKRFTIKTSTLSPFGTVEFTQKQYRPWLDHDDGGNVLFTSVHLFDNENKSKSSESMDFPKHVFYPGTGDVSENTPETDENVYPGGIFNVPIALG
jgi:acetoin utilization deacetylase AcuC-like enzyme